jgi:hypothetical protein
VTVLNKHHGVPPSDAVYIGRGSFWGNRYVIGRDGNRDEVCNKFAHDLFHFYYSGAPETIMNARKMLADLHGKDLVCFCAPARCHGDTIETYAAMAHKNLYGVEA